MKLKNTVVFIIAFMMIFTSMVSFASVKEYRLEEVGMSIEIPENMYVFTRDTTPDDKNLKELGFSYDGLKSSFELSNIYLEAVNADDFSEILVIIEDTSEKDTDKFVRTDHDGEGQYETVQNGKKILVRFVSYAGKQSDELIEEYETIIESIRFDDKDKLPVSDEGDKQETGDFANSSDDGNESTGNAENTRGEENESRSYDGVTYFVIIIGAVMAIIIIITRIIRKR